MFLNDMREKSYTERVADNVYRAILDTTPSSEEERKQQMRLLDKVNKFIYLYEENMEFRMKFTNYELAKKLGIIK